MGSLLYGDDRFMQLLLQVTIKTFQTKMYNLYSYDDRLYTKQVQKHFNSNQVTH